MARRTATEGTAQEHDWLLLVPQDQSYIRFVSDLAGFDPKTHNETVGSVVPKVTAWLTTRPDAIRRVTPRAILNRLPSFR